MKRPRPRAAFAIATLRRTAFWSLLFFFLLVWPEVSNPAEGYEIAILKSADIAAYNQAVNGFRAAFTGSSANQEGVRITEYDMQGDLARGQKLAKKIHASNPDLVLAVGIKAALAAKLELVDSPILYCMVLDPQKNGLKGNNMVGIMLEIPMSRQLTVIRSVLPNLKRVGLMYDPEKSGDLVEDARRGARELGLEIVSRPVRSEKEVPAALRSLTPQIEALWLIPDSTVLTEESVSFLLSTALETNLPVIGFSSELVRSGALVGLSVNYDDVGRQAAMLARKILNDQIKLPTTIAPERVRFSLNLKTAKFLGITIPSEVLSRADQVF